jgi:hypothetical protein
MLNIFYDDFRDGKNRLIFGAGFVRWRSVVEPVERMTLVLLPGEPQWRHRPSET